MPNYAFASDNTAGIAPEALRALLEANADYLPSYGADTWTQQAADAIRSVFDSDCEVFFVFNGTAANSLALAALCQSYHSVICHRHAHIEEDECGAPEFFSNGSKLLLGAGENGKLAAEEVRRLITQRTDLHYPKPKAVSITQSTECGTVYTPDEVAALHAITAAHGLHLHMDGARFANAVAGVGCTPAELSWKAGVEVLSFGGTKMGLPGSEALVFFNKSLATDFEYRCKQAGQLASKMRFLSAPWVGLLHDGAWLRHSAHANAMAQLLGSQLASIPGLSLRYPVQANEVFADLTPAQTRTLQDAGWVFYDFFGGCARFVCSWATSERDVHAMIGALTT